MEVLPQLRQVHRHKQLAQVHFLTLTLAITVRYKNGFTKIIIQGRGLILQTHQVVALKVFLRHI